MITKKFKTTIAAAAGLALSATPAFAAFTQGIQSASICALLDKVANFVFGIAGTIALIFLIVGGIQYTVSGGDKAAVEAARGRITAAVIGLLIVVAAYFIAKTVLGIFTATIPACVEI